MNTNEAVENKLKEDLKKLQSKNWNIEVMNAHYQLLEVIDENTVKIEGVEYKKVEEQKPQTLYDALCEKGGMYSSVCDTVVEIVKEWLPNTRFEDGNDYNIGWNDCLEKLRLRLK